MRHMAAIVAILFLALACGRTGKQQVERDLGGVDLSPTSEDTAGGDVTAEEDFTLFEDVEPQQDAVQMEDVPHFEDTAPDVPHFEDTALDIPHFEDAAPDVPPEDIFEMPQDCCFSDDDCPAADACIGYDGGPWPEAGSCEPAPAEGECWTGDDCPSNGEWCSGAVVCGCGEKCAKQPGTCIPYEGSCCSDDGDCDQGEQCIPGSFDDALAVCKEQPPAGQCWLDQQCKPGQVCDGAFVCPCDFDCAEADSPGECIYPCGEDDCCCVDEDCGEGNPCVMLENGNSCLPAQPEGMCWQDSDCGDNQFCQGAIACPCQWDCDGDGWDIPGTCKPTGGDMCCMTDADCPQFFRSHPMICLIQDGNPWVVGTCQPAAPEGKCWSVADCAEGQVCHDMYFCPCGMDCQAPGTQMGDCVTPAGTDPACVPDGTGCGTALGTVWLIFPDPWFGDGLAPDKQPLPEVKLEALKNGQVVAADTSDTQGSYSLVLSPGEYTLRASQDIVNEWETVFPPLVEQAISVAEGEETNTDFDFYWEGDMVDKPNIYLYPETTQEVSVTLEFKGNKLAKSIPDYGDGWTVIATPDGLIDGTYGYLFYEATAGGAGFQTDCGFVVSQAELAVWMEETLAAYGFNDQETVDFVDFWLPVLPESPWYLFYPQDEAMVDQHVGLHVEPAPDSLLRLWFAVQPAAAPVSLPEPDAIPFVRSGFAVTEWGVIVLH